MDILRSAFSQKKRRLIESGFNLDLTYITPRVIAMSFPASGLSKLYRNSIDDVAKFLELRHSSHYKLFNLCEAAYDTSKFDNRVVHLPWPDHHAPPLELLFKACLEIQHWLRVDFKNVVVINCLAGKGRTGTLICSYLLFCGRLSSAGEALNYFKFKRFRVYSDETGVSQPSQVRYVHYFSDVLKGRVLSPHIKLLKSVHISQGQTEFAPVMKVSVNKRVIYLNQTSSRSQQERSICVNENQELIIRVERAIFGDVICQFMHWGRMGLKKVCRFSFHASFHQQQSEITFSIDNLDPYSYRNVKEYRTGSITLKFDSMPCCSNSDCASCLRTLEDEVVVWERIHKILIYRSELFTQPSQLLFTESSPDDIDEVLQNLQLS